MSASRPTCNLLLYGLDLVVTSNATTTYSMYHAISQDIVVQSVDATTYSVYVCGWQVYARERQPAPALEEIGGGQRMPRERGSMPRGRGGHASQTGSARAPG